MHRRACNSSATACWTLTSSSTCAGPDGQRVRLICVPKFTTSGILLLVDLTTLEVEQVAFDTFFSG